ncbi:S8 family serine peptidase [Wenzhouxiangella sp. XN201]|uniref:S8 family serine peptidase n=1 Tax=Wenzhouxiangella sp. XN201 TaxID=2710755 RepID=UPI0013CD354B|nr:S8 family serine peptidase [Wenzhouxiangella sp. XN201]NEZ04827.1 S8 family serine peptidase [Wenzhouxiangella sp. XN201]
MFNPCRNHPKSPWRALQAFGLLALLAVSPFSLAATIGESLLDSIEHSDADDRLEVIVSFDGQGPLDSGQVATLAQHGLDGIYFQALPMAGVLATPEQILALSEVEDVRSLWLNERLELTNDEARALTGVDRARTNANLRNDMGFPFSGKGIGVMVNDSGIDATHPDLMLGEQTVQNVFATANLNAVDGMLPITWVEDVPDTDIGSGHGTHVAGTVAGTGAASGGDYAGVAPGAHLIGYGSGGVLFILDTLGAFDYALVNQFRYNIRVINNSWGSPGDTGTDFNPDDPTNIATKMLADRNVVIVFAAGNSGSGEDTIGGNFIKAPWVVTVGAANKNATLADFSSRGKRDGGGTVAVDGETFEWHDRPNVAAPGVDILSTMSNTNALADPVTLDYGLMSGTSMAAPHVAGIVALILEANPRLHWSEVIEILEATATNIPGREDWEVGAGMVNAHAAVAMAAGARDDYGQTVNMLREFNANVQQSRIEGPDFELYFDPLLESDEETFTVAEGLSTVIASANVSENTVALVLTDPDGNRFGSAISLPLLGPSIAVTAPARPGEWTITVRGIGAVSGVTLDPLGVTNGTAVPGTIDADVDFMRVDGFTGLDDVDGHPARGMIEFAVANRLADSRAGGVFEPDASITRAETAEYLTMGAGMRQFRPTDGTDSFFDVFGLDLASAEAGAARGGALKDMVQVQDPVVLADASGQFAPEGVVLRAELAYGLIQSLGLQAEAAEVEAALGSDPITVAVNGERIALEDDAEVPAGFRGHVQLALDLEVMGARFELEQGPFDLQPTLKAWFDPLDAVSRAGYAFAKVNFFDRYRQGQ